MKVRFIEWVLITEFELMEIFDQLWFIKGPTVRFVNLDFSWFQIIRSFFISLGILIENFSTIMMLCDFDPQYFRYSEVSRRSRRLLFTTRSKRSIGTRIYLIYFYMIWLPGIFAWLWKLHRFSMNESLFKFNRSTIDKWTTNLLNQIIFIRSDM